MTTVKQLIQDTFCSSSIYFTTENLTDPSHIYTRLKSENPPPMLWMLDVHIVIFAVPTPWLVPLQKKFFVSTAFWCLFLLALPRTLELKVIIFRIIQIFHKAYIVCFIGTNAGRENIFFKCAQSYKIKSP